MIPAQFEYHAPTSLAEALQLLQTYGQDAKVLAGGHSLLPLMKFRLATPTHLIDLGRVPDLQFIRRDGAHIVVGAMTTHWQIESSDFLQERTPLLSETAALIGDVQVRNVGTIGGSLAHADPAGDYPAAVLALDAVIVAAGPGGRREIAAADFFTGIYATALDAGEILVEISVPTQEPRMGTAYQKFPHPASGFAVAGVAAAVRVDEGERCTDARIGVTGVAPVPYRARGVEQRLRGQVLTDEVIADASAHAAEGVEVNADVFASAEYRRHLAGVMTKRALRRALDRVK